MNKQTSRFQINQKLHKKILPDLIIGTFLVLTFLFASALAGTQPPSNYMEPPASAQAPSRCSDSPPSAFINDAGTVFLDVITLGGATGFGYDLIKRDGLLFGLTVGERPTLASDGDWNILVQPLCPPIPPPLTPRECSIFQSNMRLTTGEDKKRGNIECEICDKCMELLNARLPIPDDFVQFGGFHVIDNAHGSKTEVHPILSMGIVEGGPSKPNMHEETFRLVVGAGGTCPDYSFARTTTPSFQQTITQFQLSWPPPISSATPGVTYIPAFEIKEREDPRPFMQAFTPVLGSPINGNFGTASRNSGSFVVTRVGNSVQMNGTLSVSASGSRIPGVLEEELGTSREIFDVRTFWVPLGVHVVVDSVQDLGIVRNRRPFPVRSYRIKAHVELGGDPRVRDFFPSGELEWFLHRTNAGYSTPAPLPIGMGERVEYIHDIAPSHGLSDYDLRLEVRVRTIPGLSVVEPVSIPRPGVIIREVQRNETCVTTLSGEKARRIDVVLEARSFNFTSGPDINWTISPYPLPPNAPPVVTSAGPQLAHTFFISRTSPRNYFKVSVHAEDLDHVESVDQSDFLNFVPVVQIVCKPKVPGRRDSPLILSVETLGMKCDDLQFRWHTGETTPTIEVPPLPGPDPVTGSDSIEAEVQVTDASGQSVRVHRFVCGTLSIREVRRMQLFEKMNSLRALMIVLGLLPPREPPGPDPGPEPFGPFADLMKRMVLSADSASLEVLKQRTEFIDRILVKALEAKKEEQVKVLKELVTNAMQSVRSGEYKETLRMKVQIPRTEWNQTIFQQMNELFGRIRK